MGKFNHRGRRSRVTLIKIKSVEDDLQKKDSEITTIEEVINDNNDPFPQLDLFSIHEIVENIFKYMSKHDLMTSRFVRHAWNEEICRYFRKIIVIELFDRNLFYFERLLRTNLRLKLPLPFSTYRLSIRKLDDRNLGKILNTNPPPTVTACSLIVSPTVLNSNYEKKLISLLCKNSASLQSLDLNMSRGTYLGYAPLCKLPVLSKLEKIGIRSKHRSTIFIPQESINFIINVINAAPNVKQLELNCDQENVLVDIVNGGKFENLISFYSDHVTHSQMEALAETRIPKLRKLTLKNNSLYEETSLNHAQTFQKLVNNFATTLSQMNVTWIGNDNGNNVFPYCPQLKMLTLYLYDGPLAIINSLCLPSLQQFSLVEYTEFQTAESVPHEGVMCFNIEDFSGLYLDDEFELLIHFVDKQFPKLTSLTIYMILNDACIRAIVTTLPLLKKLKIRAGTMVTEEAFTGVPVGVNLEEHLKSGKDLRDIRIFPCLANMQYVKELDVSNFPAGPLITNTAVKYGMAMMPSLEMLTMNWDSQLSENVIAECLGHLKRLKFSDWHKHNPTSSIFYLKQIMPQLYIPGYVEN